jgi:hypothetical protein
LKVSLETWLRPDGQVVDPPPNTEKRSQDIRCQRTRMVRSIGISQGEAHLAKMKDERKASYDKGPWNGGK